MNLALLHTPQDVLRRGLIALALGTNPDTDPQGDWPIYCDKEPNLPDNVITVFGDSGQDSGRVMQGDIIQFPGFQIRFRSKTESYGYAKLSAVGVALDNLATRLLVTMPVAVGGTMYKIQWVRRNLPIPLNQNKPSTRLYIYTLNGYMSLVRVP